MAAAAGDLAGLVGAGGVVLRPTEDGLVGMCPRCGSRLVVDNRARAWSCAGGCGSGGAAQWVALVEAVSVSHATALLEAGWQPDGTDGSNGGAGEAPGVSGQRTVRLLPVLCPADADDATLLDAVVEHYAAALGTCEPARAWLDRLGVDETLAARLRVGYANRTLGYRLPEANRKDGAALRGRLTQLGVYRPSGHEHLTGCLVVPILDAGRVAGLCGYRLDRPGPPLWATGLPGGIFPAVPAGDDVLVVASIRDALAVLAAGHNTVVAPGRPSGFSRRDLSRLSKTVRHAHVVSAGSDELAGRLAANGIDVSVAGLGAPLAELLVAAADRRRALDAVLTTVASASEPDNLGATPRSATDTVAATAVEGAEVSGDATELHVRFAARRWRVRGADRNRTPEVLRVALSVTDATTGAFHLDTLDLYAAKARGVFLDAASAELSTDPAALRRELTQVLFATETALAAVDAADLGPAMSEPEREAALGLLRDPALLDRISTDLAVLGVVGEQTALLVTYLATISRKADRPFGVVIQSSSAAGKSTLADTVCALVPQEDLASYSALTGQALYYVSGQSLAHKVLAVAEEQGAARASYALKLLLTEGRLTIGSTGKDPATGRLRTTNYQVAGPVALVLTTTATEIDPELANRVIVLGVDEDPAQTKAIHAAQRHAVTLDGLLARLHRDPVLALHRNAQRLLDPLPVVIADAEQLDFPAHAVRHRRDHQKLLALITASALLHQHQRTRHTVEVNGQPVIYLEAAPADVDLAVRLAAAVLARTGDELAPQTRRLLATAEALVAERTAANGEDQAARAVTFTRRELRERLGASEHQVRIGLARLVALEFVTAVPGAPGLPNRYRLTDPQAAEPCEPGGTLRVPCDSGSQGSQGLSPAQTPDPVGLRASGAHMDGKPGNVPVDVDAPRRRSRGRR